MPTGFLLALLSAAAGESSALTGAYRWESGGFVDVLVWEELGPGQLVAFDDRGWVRALTPTGAGTFTAGRSIAVPEPVGAHVRFERQTLVWEAEGQPPRVARRSEDSRVEDVGFANGDTRLAGTLFLPPVAGRHPALVLLHGSGPQNRNGTLPFARFLVRHGIAILTFDKRGVGGSQGDWRKASFETLADDALAAVAYLRARPEVDAKRVGLFGVSQGGWIGPLAASRSRDVALVVSVSGPGVTPAQQTMDMIEGEMRAEGIADAEVQEARALTQRAFDYGRTGKGWDEYAAALARSKDKSWLPYLSLPADPKDAAWEQQRLFYHYDPAPALAALRCPVLAVFGGKDLGVPAEKNHRLWHDALTRGGHRAHELVVIPGASHAMFDAATGSMFELAKRDGFVPEYRPTVLNWLRDRFGLREPARQVVFVCEHGSAKSLIASLWFNRLARERSLALSSVSRGVEPDETVPAGVRENLRKDGLDVGDLTPARLTVADLAETASVVAIGADSPLFAGLGPASLERWSDIPPASTQYEASRDAMRQRIEALLERLAKNR
jgi:pimeloyl-ACP methyl ester carboxylesterase/protein-tyrosine-phosphatase